MKARAVNMGRFAARRGVTETGGALAEARLGSGTA